MSTFQHSGCAKYKNPAHNIFFKIGCKEFLFSCLNPSLPYVSIVNSSNHIGNNRRCQDVYHEWYDKNNKHACNDQFLESRMNELEIEQEWFLNGQYWQKISISPNR
jgi:hypothetical protein